MSAFWLPVWQSKSGSIGDLSGRSTYTEAQRYLLAKEASRLLDLKRSDTLLDVGCAAGFTGELLAQTVMRYSGLDYNVQAIWQFQERTGGQYDLAIGTATDLSRYADAEFTKALMGSVLLCLSRDECRAALKELRRVTTERALISGNLEAKVPSYKPDSSKCAEGCHCHAHATWFTREELTKLAVDCGWSGAAAYDIHPDLHQHSNIMFDMVAWA